MLRISKKFRLLVIEIWLPVLIITCLTLSTNLLEPSPSFSRTYELKYAQIRHPNIISTIYEALADDIIQIFKWMETPNMTSFRLWMNILGYKEDNSGFFISNESSRNGLPSIRSGKYPIYRFSRNSLFGQYIRGLNIYIDELKSPQGKIESISVYIEPIEAKGKEETWYDNFSAIKFMDYFTQGIDKSERTIDRYPEGSSIRQTINLKQKYFKSSKIKKYKLDIQSSDTGAWRLRNGKKFKRESAPYILLKIDLSES
jgi:hypothetical protein